MVLRMMAPLVLLRDGAIYEAVPDLVEYKEVKVGTLTKTPRVGSIAVLRNLDSGEWRCGRVQAGGDCEWRCERQGPPSRVVVLRGRARVEGARGLRA